VERRSSCCALLYLMHKSGWIQRRACKPGNIEDSDSLLSSILLTIIQFALCHCPTRKS
jgi:hypothetical protein